MKLREPERDEHLQIVVSKGVQTATFTNKDTGKEETWKLMTEKDDSYARI